MGFKAHLAVHSPSLGLAAVRGRLRIPPGEVWLCRWSGPAKLGLRELGLTQAQNLKDQSSPLKEAVSLVPLGLVPILGQGPAQQLSREERPTVPLRQSPGVELSQAVVGFWPRTPEAQWSCGSSQSQLQPSLRVGRHLTLDKGPSWGPRPERLKEPR